MMTKQRDEMLTVGELASRLRVNESTVRRWIDAGAIRFVRLQKTIRIPFPQEALRGFKPPEG